MSVQVADSGFYSEFLLSSDTTTAFIKKKTSPIKKHFTQIELAKATNNFATVSQTSELEQIEVEQQQTQQEASQVEKKGRTHLSLKDILNPEQE